MEVTGSAEVLFLRLACVEEQMLDLRSPGKKRATTSTILPFLQPMRRGG